MADIGKQLEQIMKARYGRDVRQSIHDVIDALNGGKSAKGIGSSPGKVGGGTKGIGNSPGKVGSGTKGIGSSPGKVGGGTKRDRNIKSANGNCEGNSGRESRNCTGGCRAGIRLF